MRDASISRLSPRIAKPFWTRVTLQIVPLRGILRPISSGLRTQNLTYFKFATKETSKPVEGGLLRRLKWRVRDKFRIQRCQSLAWYYSLKRLDPIPASTQHLLGP